MSFVGAGAGEAGASPAPARPRRNEAAAISAAALRVQAAIAEITVAAERHLRAKKIGASPPEFYELRKITVELGGVCKRLRARLGETP